MEAATEVAVATHQPLPTAVEAMGDNLHMEVEVVVGTEGAVGATAAAAVVAAMIDMGIVTETETVVAAEVGATAGVGVGDLVADVAEAGIKCPDLARVFADRSGIWRRCLCSRRTFTLSILT